MLQQVNLLIASKEGSQTSLNATRLLQSGIAMMFFLGLVYLATWWHSADKRAEIAELTLKQNEAQVALEKLKIQKAADKTEDRLKERLTNLTTRRDAKMQMLSVLTDKHVGNPEGFSTYLAGLATERVEGVSIHAFEIAEGGARVYLEGSALEDSLVPKLIQDAGQSKAFKGKTFKQFQLTRLKGSRYVNFKIYTDQSDADVAADAIVQEQK